MTITDLTGYNHFLHELKNRIRTARTRAALAVNRELVLLYWQIGRDILERQAREGWGAKVIDRLARDLRSEFPDMKGFSPRNMLFMRSFAEAYSEEKIVKPLVSQLPWGHIVRLNGIEQARLQVALEQVRSFQESLKLKFRLGQLI